jgi:Glu-tRNA(Gln) amidotransferase subunit E-like FAD-binding protein
VHLLIKSAEETVEVHLGPEWYLKEQNFSIEPGDRIEVKGSRITFPRMPAIVAAEVKKADRVLTLRDTNGIPLWSRRQQRSKLQKVDLKKGSL